MSHNLQVIIYYSVPNQRNFVCACLCVLYLTYKFYNDLFLTLEPWENLKGKCGKKRDNIIEWSMGGGKKGGEINEEMKEGKKKEKRST